MLKNGPIRDLLLLSSFFSHLIREVQLDCPAVPDPARWVLLACRRREDILGENRRNWVSADLDHTFWGHRLVIRLEELRI